MLPRIALTLAASLALCMTPAAASAVGKDELPTPLIFVHGGSGSAQQFETNAMRLSSNGFKKSRIFVYEYSTLGSNNDAAIADLDGFIADVKEDTDSEQVDILAHSRGTTVMHAYLSTPERAESVRRYVNFDGRTAETPPGAVPTLAVWGEGDQEREIAGAENVYFPDKAHTEVTTSQEAFKDWYEFLLDRKPKTTKVVPEKPKKVTVKGRALIFPNNTGIDGATLRVYALDSETGQRDSNAPVYEKAIDATGEFGPIDVNGRRHYEFEVSQEGQTTIHNYPEPFERDNHFYRVLSPPVLAPFIERSPGHVSVTVTRMREFWGDQSPSTSTSANDELEIGGVNVINAAISPRSRRVLAVFTFDKNSDGVTDLSEPLAPFSGISFLTAADLFTPASPDANGTVAVTETMRSPHGQTQTTHVPDWPSDEHSVSVYFKDYDAKAFKKPKK
ncbi:MAG TPA: hypothetical protein VD766_10065 [Solirubrobacterales bacterium]|nr:hypothetical protein [Solirubrobacterales bacterium]